MGSASAIVCYNGRNGFGSKVGFSDYAFREQTCNPGAYGSCLYLSATGSSGEGEVTGYCVPKSEEDACANAHVMRAGYTEKDCFTCTSDLCNFPSSPTVESKHVSMRRCYQGADNVLSTVTEMGPIEAVNCHIGFETCVYATATVRIAESSAIAMCVKNNEESTICEKLKTKQGSPADFACYTCTDDLCNTPSGFFNDATISIPTFVTLGMLFLSLM